MPSSQWRFPMSPSHADQASCVVGIGAAARSQVLEDLPVRAAAAVLVVGDDLLAAGADDADARLPVRAVGRDLELQHRVALSRIEPVLHGEHARPDWETRIGI